MSIAKPILLLALAAALANYAVDCSAMNTPEQAMQCCGSMPCPPHHGDSEDCCKTMPSAQALNMLPAAHSSLRVPAVATFKYTRTLDITPLAPVPLAAFEAQQHSPPELYTLHASLLI